MGWNPLDITYPFKVNLLGLWINYAFHHYWHQLYNTFYSTIIDTTLSTNLIFSPKLLERKNMHLSNIKFALGFFILAWGLILISYLFLNKACNPVLKISNEYFKFLPLPNYLTCFLIYLKLFRIFYNKLHFCHVRDIYGWKQEGKYMLNNNYMIQKLSLSFWHNLILSHNNKQIFWLSSFIKVMVGSSLKPSHSYILCHKIDTMDIFNPLENNSPLHHPKTTKIIELAVVAYGVGVLQLIKWLKEAYPDVIYPCYAGKEGALGTYEKIELYFNFLKRFGHIRGYYPKTSKSVLTVLKALNRDRKSVG